MTSRSVLPFDSGFPALKRWAILAKARMNLTDGQDAKEADTSLLPGPDNAWHPIARVAFRFAFVYFGLYIVTTQMFWSGLLPAADLNPLANLPPLRYAISWVARHLFGVTAPLVIEGSGSGDKIFDWAHVCLLLALATGVTVIWSILDRRRKSYRSLDEWFRIGVRLGLGTTMLSYGVAKAVPLQMGYGPSLTRLVEPFGSFSPMGVLWTFMGSSPAYQSFTGCTEILGGVLLLIPQTALLGALISFAVSFQIFVLNMTYDVPVKLLSFHLVLLSLFLILPDWPRLRNFFLLNRTVAPAQDRVTRSPRRSKVLLSLQLCFALYVMLSLAYGAKQGWFEFGGGAPKPPLYGIWNVDQMQFGDQVRPPLVTDDQRWRRVIFDRPGRAVFQKMDDSLVVFAAKIDPEGETIELTKTDDKNWKATLSLARPAPDRLTLNGAMDRNQLVIDLRLDREQFLVLNRGFHWVQERPFNR